MELTEAFLVVIVAFFVAGAALKGLSWARRRSALQDIDPGSVIKEHRGVSMRVLVQGTKVLPGMKLSKANRTTGDLVLLADRFVLTSGRGVIADLRESRGRRFSSVRCTGPGRLIIEGEVPGPGEQTGMYRVEMVLEDAPGWAAALKPWVIEGGDFVSL